MPAGAEADVNSAGAGDAVFFKERTTCLHQKCTVLEMDGSEENKFPSDAQACRSCGKNKRRPSRAPTEVRVEAKKRSPDNSPVFN